MPDRAIMYEWSMKKLKRLIVAVIGITILIIGVVMIFLPGPAIIVIPAALGILATEFAWARKLLLKMKEQLHSNTDKRKNT
jgi:uncharacterized protein (TIGR02611 family)